jgi:hypothetical protein
MGLRDRLISFGNRGSASKVRSNYRADLRMALGYARELINNEE